MIKRLYSLLLMGIMIVTASGCSDRSDLEDVAFTLLLGYDLDERNNLLLYALNPVFSKDVKKKSQELVVQAETTRYGREQADALSAGKTIRTKLYIILVGKKLLQHEDWFQMLDVLYRDPKNSISAKVIVCDEPLSEIVYLNKKDQPLLPLFLRGMLVTKSAKAKTVDTNLKELQRQMYEKGMTPAISEIELNNNEEIEMKGTALLDERGKFAASLDSQESTLLQILQNKSKENSFSIPIPGEPKHSIFATDWTSFDARRTKTKIKTSYRDDKFRFDIQIKMPVVLTERLFPYEVERQGKQLDKAISEQMQKLFENLVKKIRKYHIDPIGLGLYARAYEYKQYKKAEDHWGETLSEADIQVSVKATIEGMGTTK